MHQLTKQRVLTVVRDGNERFRVNVIVDRCKECYICIHTCPKKVFTMSSNFNARGFHYPEPVNVKECIGCRLCEYYCPDFAIFVEVLKG